ncbi:hypothetical protein [Arthrobacter sp. PAMC25284]|uniref:hypothetical protein n=1 Tax=Arthrobacter sp. PAMC25284 TaxID=2861279 RepID=UPI001C62733C|nr:hypothetical protein [Arthrobacter sp. PAMC25284]QYF88480.1 hypothetical protein KY499_09270 [Arthrobacter sp. PAMC25284]
MDPERPRPVWQSALVATARAIGFGSLKVLEAPDGTVFYDGTPGLLTAFGPHSFEVLEREARLPAPLRLEHRPGLQGEELFREDPQGGMIAADGLL